MVKTVNVDYNYQLVANSQFHRFPDMDISIYLKYPQFVAIIYNIGVSQPRSAYIETRVLIDGVEEKLMHRMADYTWTHQYLPMCLCGCKKGITKFKWNIEHTQM